MTSCTVGSDKDTMIPDEIIKVIDKVIDGKLSDRSIWPLVGFFTIHAHKLKDYVPQV